MKKAKVLQSSKWFLKEKTPLPYPEAGLRDSNAEEEDDEDDDDDEVELVSGEQDTALGPSALVLEDISDPPASVPDETSDPSVSVPKDVFGSSVPSVPAPVDPALPTET